MAEKMKTRTEMLGNALNDGRSYNEFLEFAVSFLRRRVWSGVIYGGRGLCNISMPQDHSVTQALLDELKDIFEETCINFLTKKLTPEFIQQVQKTHRGEADKHISVRTTLQIMFVNKLKKNTNPRILVCTNHNGIEIYLKESYAPNSLQIINGNAIKDLKNSKPGIPFSKEETGELLRRFRIMLTRIAGEGDVSLYPTPYECYCLYHECYGKKRENVVREYVSDPEKQKEFLKDGKWNDETVGALLSCYYNGQMQNNKRRISCERRTIGNRRKQYQDYLQKCILTYMPDAKENDIQDMLGKHTMDGDTAFNFFASWIRAAKLSSKEDACKLMQTRTLEKQK